MSGGVDLTEPLLKAHARTFDLDAVFTLTLSGTNLRTLHASLGNCSSLASLDLSLNRLGGGSSSLRVLGKLGKLTKLSLASNGLPSLFDLPPMPALREIRLEGNGLGDGALDALQERCPHLEVVWFQSSDGATNPLCTPASYRSDVLARFPRLKVLDGERLATPEGQAFATAYRSMDQATLQYADGAAAAKASQLAMLRPQHDKLTKTEDWLPQGTWPAVLASDVDADLAPRVAGVRSSLAECQRVLKEEADKALHEMRKYDTKEATRSSPTPDEQGTNFGTFAEDD